MALCVLTDKSATALTYHLTLLLAKEKKDEKKNDDDDVYYYKKIMENFSSI